MTKTRFHQWFTNFSPRPSAELTLFCFPYAGGGASTYRNWAKLLPAEIEVIAIQLPGRESRFVEPHPDSFAKLVEEVVEAIAPRLIRPFAFFGHSMGAYLSYETACRLTDIGCGKRLEKIFVSGASAPNARDSKPPLYDLPDDKFIDALRDLNGTSDLILENQELTALLIPTVRADMKLLETHSFGDPVVLPIPICAFGGLEDDATLLQLKSWGSYTSGAIELEMFAGDHFFIDSAINQVLKSVAFRLRGSIPPRIAFRSVA
jgi:medium-chain acyl-[acyl-carrier-protein] hydrolase